MQGRTIPKIEVMRPPVLQMQEGVPAEFELVHEYDEEAVYLGPKFDAGRYPLRLGIRMLHMEDGEHYHWRVYSTAEENEDETLEEWFDDKLAAQAWAKGKENVHWEEAEEPLVYGELFILPQRVDEEHLKRCATCVGQDPETIKELDETIYYELVLGYGLTITVSMYQGVGKLYTDNILEQLRRDAAGVVMMPGFQLDAQLNAIGWTGWSLLQEWGASIGGDSKEDVALDDPADGPVECINCGEEREGVQTYRMDGEPDPVPVCEQCLDAYITCDGCSILVYVESTGWHGPDMYETIDGDRLCRDCFTSQFEEGKVISSQAIQGGSPVTFDHCKTAKRIPGSNGGESWEVVYSERVSDQFHEWISSDTAVAHMSQVTEAAKPSDQFVIGLEASQFFIVVSLFKRRTPCPNTTALSKQPSSESKRT